MGTDCVNTVADLKALTPSDARCIRVLGYHQPNDGGGGDFFWDKEFPEKEDGGTIIRPNLPEFSEKGRWRRIINEPVSVKWFGTRGNGLEEDTDAMQNAIQAVEPGEQLVIPAGTYRVKSLHIKSAISLQGIGKPTITSDNTGSDPGDGGFHAVILINNGKIVDRNSNTYGGLEDDVKISNIEIEYSGRKPQSTGNINLVEGIFARMERRFRCENLEIHGAAHCGIYGFSSNAPLRPGQAKGCESILENVYCHDNGYAGAMFGGLGVVAMPGCRFENNGGGPNKGWNGIDGYGISIHNAYGIVMGCRFAGNWSQQIDCHGFTGHLIVAGNTIKFNGNEGQFANGVSITVTESVLVTNNIIEGYTNPEGKPFTNHVQGGISIVGKEYWTPTLSNVTVLGNIIRDFADLYVTIGIYSVDTESIIIKDNQIIRCTGKENPNQPAILIQNSSSGYYFLEKSPYSHRYIPRLVRVEDNMIDESGPITIISASELWLSGNSWTWSTIQKEWIDSIGTRVNVKPQAVAIYIGPAAGTKSHIGRIHIDRPNRICGPAIPYSSMGASMFTTVPVRFSWALGDKAPNIQPREGDVMEWICTTPGTAERLKPLSTDYLDEPVPPTKCTVHDKTATIDQIEDVSNLMPGDFIKVSYQHEGNPNKYYLRFAGNDAVEVLNVEGAITIGATKKGETKITDVTGFRYKDGKPQGSGIPILKRFLKKGDYIMIEIPGRSPITFGPSRSVFVKVESIDGLTLNVAQSANDDTPRGLEGIPKGIIRVNRCTINTPVQLDAVDPPVNVTLRWQKAVFSTVGKLTKV
jgi:hypothetical protein